MTKNLILILALTGCSGESFTGVDFSRTGGDAQESDSGALGTGGSVDDDGGGVMVGTGGHPQEKDGSVRHSSGGSSGSTGGAPSATGGSVGTGGAVIATGGTMGTGGATATGGVTGTGGVTATGGATATGGVTGTGGVTATGGVTGTGGTTACTLVTHDNGLGQTWQDCVPLYTYDENQAMKACQASGAPVCLKSTRCGATVYEVMGKNADLSQWLGEWGYSAFAMGLVSPDSNLCTPDDPANRHWK